MRDRAARKNAGCPSAEDFAWWQERAAGMTDWELHAAARDAFGASKSLDPLPVAGWYSDEGGTYLTELRRRGWRPTLDRRS